MSLQLVPKLVTFNEMAKWPLFCVILPNLVVFGVHCIKVVEQYTITMFSSKRLQRDRATPAV